MQDTAPTETLPHTQYTPNAGYDLRTPAQAMADELRRMREAHAASMAQLSVELAQVRLELEAMRKQMENQEGVL